MQDFTQIPIIEDPEEARCPCLLILDVSHSMSGDPIDRLNRAIKQFSVELSNDPLARKRVEVGIVTFGGDVRVHTDFTEARDFRPTELRVNGATPMCEAIQTGVGLIERRKGAYRKSGTAYHRPWIFLISDGVPTDANPKRWSETVTTLMDGERDKRFAFYAIGVKGVDFDRLQQLSSHRDALRLQGLKFGPFFEWLSKSLATVSKSSPGDAVPLENPWGWAEAPS